MPPRTDSDFQSCWLCATACIQMVFCQTLCALRAPECGSDQLSWASLDHAPSSVSAWVLQPWFGDSRLQQALASSLRCRNLPRGSASELKLVNLAEKHEKRTYLHLSCALAPNLYRQEHLLRPNLPKKSCFHWVLFLSPSRRSLASPIQVQLLLILLSWMKKTSLRPVLGARSNSLVWTGCSYSYAERILSYSRYFSSVKLHFAQRCSKAWSDMRSSYLLSVLWHVWSYDLSLQSRSWV